MSTAVAFVLGILAALAATIVAFVLVVPEKKRAGLNKFFQWIHDFFNFKSLWLEKILKFLYIFETLACIGIGFFMLFTVSRDWWSGRVVWTGYWGLLVIVLGPVITRILYEFLMLTILMVKNTMEINRKLVAQPGSPADIKAKEDAKRAEEEAARKAEIEAARAQYQAQQQQYQQMQYAQQQQPAPYAQPVQQPTPYAQPVQPQPYEQPQYVQPVRPQNGEQDQ